MLKKIKLLTSVVALGFTALVACSTASATVLTANTNIDNGYQIFISTNDSVQGTLFGSANNWYGTYTDTTTLAAGTDYFLHIFAYDQGGIAGALGDFSLSGIDHTFANTLTTLTTNTTNWNGNNTGWGAANTALVNLGQNGVWPWGYQSQVSGAANWIWAGNAWNDNVTYLSTKITAASQLPEPSSLLLLAFGVVGLGVMRRKTQA